MIIDAVWQIMFGHASEGYRLLPSYTYLCSSMLASTRSCSISFHQKITFASRGTQEERLQQNWIGQPILQLTSLR